MYYKKLGFLNIRNKFVITLNFKHLVTYDVNSIIQIKKIKK